MLRPSYSDLLEVLNNGEDTADAIGSRYTIVIAVAKRARQLVDGAIPLAEGCKVNKPVSIAVHELYEKKIQIKQKSKNDDKKAIMENIHANETEDFVLDSDLSYGLDMDMDLDTETEDFE